MTYIRKKPKRADSGLHTLAIDFDGVLMDKTNSVLNLSSAGLCIGYPMLGVEEGVKRLASRYELVVFSARASVPEGREAIEKWLELWRLAHYFKFVTHEKINALAYLDDRGVRFENWDSTLEYFNA